MLVESAKAGRWLYS
ncbi:DUF1493 family protein [Salmonella enterica]|nr:DUF1493 family protein [Salmonella enterica subsp. enterica]EGL5561473.1 DUF1493 family protein [Salmonella enterica]